jgi:Flp pilus assembly protein TadG
MVRRRAQSMVEFALLVPVFVLLVFGMVDLGVAVFSYGTLTHGTQTAAAYASLHCSYTGTSYTAAQLGQQVITAGTLLQAPNLTVTATAASACTTPGMPITVTSTYLYHPLTPMLQAFMPAGGLPLQTTAQVLAQ